MNKFKEEKKKDKKERRKLGAILVSALELELLSKKDIRKWLPFMLFVSVLAFYYISNRLKAEKQIRHLNQLQTDIRDAQADYHTLKSELANRTRRSIVTQEAKDLGLVFPKKKPEIIQLGE